MQMHGLPFKVPNTSRPACPCTAGRVKPSQQRLTLVRGVRVQVQTGLAGLTGALGEVGDVLVVEHHLVLQHVGQASEPRAAHDAHHGSDIRLGQQPVGRGLAVLVAITRCNKNLEFKAILAHGAIGGVQHHICASYRGAMSPK